MSTLTEKQQYWSEHLQKAEAFDGTMADYARQQGLSPQHLYQWRSELRKRERKQSDDYPVFTEVKPPSYHSPTQTITLQLGRAHITFSSLPDAQWLARLIIAHG